MQQSPGGPVATPDNDFSPEPAAQAPFAGTVVGIGASAGGLDALERFFGALPADTGAAFVVIQHLSPDHKSMMDNLLARYTAMPVRVAEHGMPLAANAVFLIPPGKYLRLLADRLQLAPKAEHGLSLPIDIFFHSLADQWGDAAVAVVLSGTGSDGSRGLATVNAAGGFVFVQDPSSAKFDGMPRSALATGLVDVVAPAEALAARLVTQLRTPREPTPRLSEGESAYAPGGASLSPLDAILEQLVASSGIDFREYKPATVLRRIERRMQLLRTPTLADYQARLAASADEQTLLRRELLIPVTRFFRDPEAFEQLAQQVLPALVATASAEPIRVWVACCATGEEAYSLAMLFAEALQRLGPGQPRRPVKIFATDVEQLYLDQATAGFFPDTIAAEVSAARLEQFFVVRQGGYAVRPELRQMVIFARHNLVGDPPFTRMDLVSCRNALIYLQPVAQERALRRLQYALVPGGHLLLGPSETLGVLHRDFQTLPGRGKLYRLLRHDRLAIALDGGSRHLPTVRRLTARGHQPGSSSSELASWVSRGQRHLQQAYVPLTLLLGPGRELLHVYGQAGGLLQFTEGQATLDVVKLLPRELAWAAGLLLQAVAADGLPHTSAVLRMSASVDEDSDAAPGPQAAQRVRLTARPLRHAATGPEDDTAVAVQRDIPAQVVGGVTPIPAGAGYTLLSIEPLQGPEPAASLTALDAEQQRRVETLERELEITHDNLQTTIEALETANEELQATNEELMAANEELQSTNEELQSVNEELYTVNSEFQAKVDVLNSVNADLENIAKATAIPTLFVDDALRLMRFTPELLQLFKLRESDRGRCIEDFAHALQYPELFSDLRRTLADGQPCEREVRGRDGRWWLARIQPYSGRSTAATRAVMSFVDVTSLRDVQRLQGVIDSLAEHLAVLDAQGTITLVNAAWRRFAACNGDEDLSGCGPGSNYLKVCAHAALHEPLARQAYEGLSAVLSGAQPLFTMRYPCHTPEREIWFLMHVAPISPPGSGVVVSHIEVTEGSAAAAACDPSAT